MKTKTLLPFNIGEILARFYANKKLSMLQLGKSLGYETSTIMYHKTKADLNLTIIYKYSVYFKHNFFLDIAATLPKDYTTNAPQAETEMQQIEALTQELQSLKDAFLIVKTERDLMKEILGTRKL
jgi:hypothetical protein